MLGSKTARAGHCWVVCGRDQAGDITNLGSWGSNAFTIDVWAGRIHSDPAVEPDPVNDKWNIDQAAQNEIVVLTKWIVN